jgi:hypothetical protein
MSRCAQSLLRMVVAGKCLVACVSLAGAAPDRPDVPNLVFVFADQMRGSAMGFLGEEPVVTPNLDRLAQQSVVFTQAASNYPVCSPYRAMLMTGQYPPRDFGPRR